MSTFARRLQFASLVVAGIVCARVASSGRAAAAPVEPGVVLPLWPDAAKAPGETSAAGVERLVIDRRRPFRQITDVAVPAVSIYAPPDELRTGAAVLVCPGGGMQRLALEHEGREAAEWLNRHGLTACVLKYRVPAPSSTGLIDAQRAMGLLRQRAREMRIDPARIAVMGFSAGGEIAVLLAANCRQRTYEEIDEADRQSCRPSHVCAIYPGGIVRPGETALRSDIADKLAADATPAMFLVHAFRDASENSLALAAALKRAGIACELHLYQEGGHGFGFRDSNLPLTAWKEHCLQWLAADGFLDKPIVGQYVAKFLKEAPGSGPLPRFSAGRGEAALADGYAAQRRLVAARLAQGDQIAGFKASKSLPHEQRALGIEGPLTGVLFKSGRIDAQPGAVIDIGDAPQALVETELGFIISSGLDISTRLTTIEQVRGAVEAVVPVIELPIRYGERMEGDLTAVDVAAINAGASRFVVGAQRASPDWLDPDGLQIELWKDGQLRHRASADIVKGGQWANLQQLINGVVDRGRTVHAGDLFICGALGEVRLAEPGKYRAEFSGLGSLEFELRK